MGTGWVPQRLPLAVGDGVLGFLEGDPRRLSRHQGAALLVAKITTCSPRLRSRRTRPRRRPWPRSTTPRTTRLRLRPPTPSRPSTGRSGPGGGQDRRRLRRRPTWSRWSAPARGSRAASSSNDPTNQEVISKPRDQGGQSPVGMSVSGKQVRLLDGWRGAWLDSDMQGGPVDELLGAAVERPALDQL